MRLWTFAIAVCLVGCVGGPGDGFGGDGGVGSSSGSSGNSSSGGSSSGSSGSSGGASTQIRASDFTQSCQVASDCTPIYQGEVCTPCACPNAAIATTQLDAYQSKLTQIRSTCGPLPAIACADCANATPLCAGNKCNVAIGVVPADAGAD
jgi:hypothetical protein